MLEKPTPVTHISTYAATDNLFFLIRLYGLSMPQRHKTLYCIYAAFFIGYSTVYTPFSFLKAIFGTSSLKNDLSIFLTTLQLSFNIFGGTAKIVCVRLMLHKLRGASKIIDKLEERCCGPDEIDERIRVVKFGRRIVVLTIMCYLLYAIMSVLGAVALGRPPYMVYFPYIDGNKTRWEFYLVSFLEFMMVIMACVQQTINDSYVSVFICIIRAQVRILKMRISKLGFAANLSPQEHVRELNMCINEHKLLLTLQKQIEPLLMTTIFIQFSITAIMLGLTLINITFLLSNLSIRIGCCFYFVAVTLQSYPLCYFAQCLQNESVDLSSHIFHSNWINQSAEYRKILIVFIQRTQKPIVFVAGKLFPINLQSFLSIAKFSFSLYTLLKKMDLDKKYVVHE